MHKIAFAFVLLLGATNCAPAQATDLPAAGAEGGGIFRADCPSGEYLVGVSIKSGAWIDAVAPLCAPFLADQGKFGKWKRGPRHGGRGGSPLLKDSACPKDRHLLAVAVGVRDQGKFLKFIDLQCATFANDQISAVCLTSGERCHNVAYNVPSCPLGETATGLHGRTGEYVDALGLICGPKPVFTAAPAPQEPPPPPAAPAPPPPAAPAPTTATLVGLWDTQTDEGVSYTLIVEQQGGVFTAYVGAVDAKLDGTMQPTLSGDGKQMAFILTQPKIGVVSRGQISLSGNGDAFEGRITKDTDGIPRIWKGTRRK